AIIKIRAVYFVISRGFELRLFKLPTEILDVSFGYDPRPFANITLKLYLIRKSGESGTDVYRSFTRVYVVFCNWNKPNN
ncbi:MAG TPA: hypothetical protein PLF17_13640, partial [Chitinophagaceae bacterium]|nr:hypothetical protein [Chitinophagaceae bacterium]